MLNKLKKRAEGFTIIEVLIVLAIAGLIMLVVFLAVPALQRNSRNTQRRADTSKMGGLVNEYVANHGGSLPTTIGATGLDISNEKWAIMTAPVTADIVASGNTTQTGTTSVMKVHPGVVCNTTTNTLATAGATSRSVAIEFEVETGGAAQNVCFNI